MKAPGGFDTIKPVMHMNLFQLQTFCTVCDCLSFTEAAAKLNISQPAVSRQISAMETEIGTALFERVHSTIELTAAGQYLKEQLPDALSQINGILQRTKAIGYGETGQLHVGLLEDQSLDPLISDALQRLQQEHISLRIQRFDFRSLESALIGGQIDIAVSIRQGVHTFPNCECFPYASEAMCYAVSAQAVPESRQEISMAEIRSFDPGYPLLIPSLDSFQPRQLQELQSLSGESGPFGREYDFSSISPMVAAGLAATVANETHILSLDRTVRLIPISEIPSVQKGVFWIGKNRNPVVARLLRLLEEPDR